MTTDIEELYDADPRRRESRKLVIAAAELSQLRSTTPAEWKKRVTMLATTASK